MYRNRLLTVAGTALLVVSLLVLVFLCTNTRIDPKGRASYEIDVQPADDDMALLLQILNGTNGAGTP